MSSRYTKYNSAYIIRKKQQRTSGGTIYYRDWVTTGGWDRFVPGKTPYYKNGNFVFTTSATQDYQKKHKYGSWVGTYTYDDVKDAVADSNEVSVNMSTDDLRDYAYFGSCVELVRATVENIINYFPARITGTSTALQKETEDGYENIENGTRYIINNPFSIDLLHTGITSQDDVNLMRYLSYSYENYLLNDAPVTAYDVAYTDDYAKFIACPQQCNYANVVIITIESSAIDDESGGTNLKIFGYNVDGEIIFTSTNKEFVLQPSDEIIEEYFSGLTGFEKQLLTRDTEPLYKNSFITPIEGNKGIKYVYRDYTWPSDDYCIDISSPLYYTFLNRLINMATKMDEIDTDCLYRCLTHEAIKNYDWTYTQEYTDGDEEDYVEGGSRVEQLLRLIGRFFDDRKREIDGIKFSSNITYNGFNNQADALLSDTVDADGWDSVSIIPTFSDEDIDVNSIKLTSEYLSGNGWDWYTAWGADNVTPVSMDIEFMRRLSLNSKRIFATKGTIQAIDMVMGMFGFGSDRGDYNITEKYYTMQPLSYDEYYDVCYEINQNKDLVLLYDDEDEFSGVPLKVVSITTTTTDEGNNVTTAKTNSYLIPYFDNTKEYDGNLYFQSKGGWCADNESETLHYLETMNYLRTVSNIAALFNVDVNDLNDGDIYYVINIDDILDYDNRFSDDLSQAEHTFYVTNKYLAKDYSGWENTAWAEDNDDADIKQRASYLQDVVSVSTGNNPHVGYGAYDLGQDFISHMEKPFKYAIDNNYLNSEYTTEANKIEFASEVGSGEKIKIVTNEELTETCYVNSKVIVMENGIDSDLYKQYFNDVILNYILQVVPSTTILVLSGYRINEGD